MAAPPDVAREPDAGTTASPNQSLSIEDDAARQVVPGNKPNPSKKEDDAEIAAVPLGESNPVGADPVGARPPIFLGRKRLPGEPAPPINHVESPWYRTSFGALGLVLALMALLYFGLRRWAPSVKFQDGGVVRILGRTVVGPRQSLLLVRVGQRVVMVGVSPDRIERVCELADAEEVAAITSQASGGRTKAEFSAWLDKEAAEFADAEKAGESPTAGSRGSSGSRSLTELLQKLRATKV